MFFFFGKKFYRIPSSALIDIEWLLFAFPTPLPLLYRPQNRYRFYFSIWNASCHLPHTPRPSLLFEPWWNASAPIGTNHLKQQSILHGPSAYRPRRQYKGPHRFAIWKNYRQWQLLPIHTIPLVAFPCRSWNKQRLGQIGKSLLLDLVSMMEWLIY